MYLIYMFSGCKNDGDGYHYIWYMLAAIPLIFCIGINNWYSKHELHTRFVPCYLLVSHE